MMDFKKSACIKSLLEMNILSFAQAVKDIPRNQLKELSFWLSGCGVKARIVQNHNDCLDSQSEDDAEVLVGERTEVEYVSQNICSYERFLSSKSRSATKRQAVKQKRHRQKETALKCGYTVDKQRKTRITLSKIDVVDPEDVWWDVYQQRNEDYIQDYLYDLAQLPQDEPCENPDHWDLNLEPYITDMHESICGSWYDSDFSFDEDVNDTYYDLDSDLDW